MAPWTTVRVEGLTEIEKSFDGGVPVIVRDTVVVWIGPVLPVPRTVRANVPGVAEAVVATVSLEELPARTEVGTNEPVAPLGNPLTDRLTVWVFPDVTVVLTVYVVLAP